MEVSWEDFNAKTRQIEVTTASGPICISRVCFTQVSPPGVFHPFCSSVCFTSLPAQLQKRMEGGLWYQRLRTHGALRLHS